MTQGETAVQTSPDDLLRFGFGENWRDFIAAHYSDERVEISRNHLLNFLKLPDFTGRTFLDIGCGSGLHSLAAWRSHAARVLSFDYDEHSVTTTRQLHALAGHPPNWEVRQGSILDRAFVDSLPPADIVYSWGVLHHTGAMWQAIVNAARLMTPAGMLYIALYSKENYVDPPYQYWLKVKKRYNQAGRLQRFAMEIRYAWDEHLKKILRKRRNPVTFLKEYKKYRGMSYWHDVRDWLGGYPMEFAGHRETEAFCRTKLGLELVNLSAKQGNTEFLFRRSGERGYWDEAMATFPRYRLSGPFTPVGGFAWRATLPAVDVGDPLRLMVYENDYPMGWPLRTPKLVVRYGNGRYAVCDGTLVFSTSDNSDPNASGRTFSLRANFL